VATLFHEKSFIIFSVYVANYIFDHGFSIKKNFYRIVLLGACFLSTYFILKTVNNGATSYLSANYISFEWVENFYNERFLSFVSILFFVGFIILIPKNTQEFKRISIFLICSLPYIIAMFWIGILWETRIWLSVLLPLFFISLLDSNSNSN